MGRLMEPLGGATRARRASLRDPKEVRMSHGRHAAGPRPGRRPRWRSAAHSLPLPQAHLHPLRRCHRDQVQQMQAHDLHLHQGYRARGNPLTGKPGRRTAHTQDLRVKGRGEPTVIPIDRPLTMVIDARRRDLARVFLAAFVALSLLLRAAGSAGPGNVVMAAEASGGEANPEDAAAGGDAAAPSEGAGESDEAANDGEPEAGSGEGEEPGHDDEGSPEPGAGEGEAITEDGIADLPAVQLMGGPGGGGHGGGGGNGTVVIHKFGKGVAGNEFPLNGARFKVEREEWVCTIIILPPFFLCWH